MIYKNKFLYMKKELIDTTLLVDFSQGDLTKNNCVTALNNPSPFKHQLFISLDSFYNLLGGNL